ncbi:MAG: MarR family transcriptional regulator [Deltaproteobacteria bacterium]|nr:MAG: MarR family transcriptional regulator [Deltaproteobacteria bacterium]
MNAHTDFEHHFVEEWGLIFAASGAAPMMGRILGYLLICDPPVQSSAQLAEALDASKGSISTATRQLLQAELIERVPVRGSRATHFRLRDKAMEQHMESDLARLAVMIRLLDSGLERYGDDPDRVARMAAFRDFYAYLLEELPALFERWSKQRESR